MDHEGKSVNEFSLLWVNRREEREREREREGEGEGEGEGSR